MNLSRAIAAAAVMAGLAGCAGSTQTLTLDTDPPGADCSLTRNGLAVGRVNPTPGTVQVQRSTADLAVTCDKDGYRTGTFVNQPHIDGESAGYQGFLMGGMIGAMAIPSTSKGDTYAESVRVTLAPIGSAVPSAATAASRDSRLATLKQLLDEKLITPEEYETRRKAILNDL
jgi:hypothetical protein